MGAQLQSIFVASNGCAMLCIVVYRCYKAVSTDLADCCYMIGPFIYGVSIEYICNSGTSRATWILIDVGLRFMVNNNSRVMTR